jgi:hypothetical protein
MTSELPFKGKPTEQRESILKDKFTPISDIVKYVYDKELVEIVHSMLSKVLLNIF